MGKVSESLHVAASPAHSRNSGAKSSTAKGDAVSIRYQITPVRPEAHLFEVRCTVAEPEPSGQRFALPAWIPGSYLIRDFARHVVSMHAASSGKTLALRKLDKHTWQCAPCRDPLSVTLQVYAFDASVRGAYLDTTRGFFNGASVFLRPLGQEHLACRVEIIAPRGRAYDAWRVATALSRASTDGNGFGGYRAADYEELIDHPVELGMFSIIRFRACGVPHEVVISGRHDADLRRLARDLKKICETQIRFFEPRSEAAPFERYVFLINAQGEGYGGLEHRASTALLCSRHELPQAGIREVSDDYRNFLGLASHEYFHAWNVKRIRPAAFTPYDLERENHTGLLWVFEGITSYYDDLLLVRSGLISPDAYLRTLAKNIGSLLRTPGRSRQTLVEASWDAWIKYYRQDEGSPNSQVSYYLKGALAALCLDLLIRQQTRNRKSLDTVMRALWRAHGKNGTGLAEDGFESIAEKVTGLKLKTFFDAALRSTKELPLVQLLARVGVKLEMRRGDAAVNRPSTRAPAKTVDLGIRTTEDAAGVRLSHVLDGGAAQHAGLCPGDLVIAIDGLRATGKSFERLLKRLRPGQTAQLYVFRRDELLPFTVTTDAPKADTCSLIAPSAPVPASFKAWLGI